ncbi:MAG: aldo/keto reductase [bacterium]|nr:aldo/keto reductase [bacterium]
MNTTHATVAATESYSRRFPEVAFNLLSDTGLRVSPIAFGSYRIDTSFPEHREALHFALRSGVNLIDTSTNYTDGGSELLIGSVIEDIENSGTIGRDEFVIVSKVGYLQGRVYRLSQNLKNDDRGYPDLVNYSVGLEHCIHPTFIEDQLTASLSRLNCGSIDVYLLHNPEYYLSWAKRNDIDVEKAREEYYRRIRLAFEHLEKERSRGRIRCYGISSNTFPVSADEYEFTSFERVIGIAGEISPLHHFKVIQMPFNLIENGCAVIGSQTGELTVLELARRHNIALLANRPLNAIYKNGLVRLSEENPQSGPLKEIVLSVDAEWGIADTLSQMAVRCLRSSQGVTSVLVGMRQKSYVEDMLAELRRSCKVDERSRSWKKLNSILQSSTVS